MRSFQNDINKKIVGLRSSDPKAYWSLLNKYSSEKKETLFNISSQVFYEHFVKLNQNVDSDNGDFFRYCYLLITL